MKHNLLKHTPGPWVIDGQYIHGPDGKRFLAVAGDEAGQANIRLIAAAPELLEALKMLLVITNSRGESLGLDDGGPVLDRARAAIAKATQS